ncbi:MAG TPA: hypothetical protein VFE36_17015 [Candidatus Baltobacteraceae bacterium]|jgi:hypothetical protein|nr:hypothetical protein [Candidatus Baltobacteraceae bacterium]
MDRAELHHLVDELPEGEVGHIAALVSAARLHDRVAIQTLLAEEVAVEQDEADALADVDRSGETISLSRTLNDGTAFGEVARPLHEPRSSRR